MGQVWPPVSSAIDVSMSLKGFLGASKFFKVFKSFFFKEALERLQGVTRSFDKLKVSLRYAFKKKQAKNGLQLRSSKNGKTAVSLALD